MRALRTPEAYNDPVEVLSWALIVAIVLGIVGNAIGTFLYFRASREAISVQWLRTSSSASGAVVRRERGGYL